MQYQAYEGQVSLGTPVEVPDEDEGRKKPINLQDQVVTDDRGRRRFHGAFTGGFSAGYFNSVGSKEGWAPSTFKSSRASQGADQGGRSEKGRQTQSIEDFMDDEDKSDIGFAPMRVSTTKQFASSKRQNPVPTAASGVLAGTEFQDLVVPVNESAGARLLKLMGWREGQGVGPRKPARRAAAATDLDGSDDDTADIDIYTAGKMFAPRDISISAFTAKDNLHGIGYIGIRTEDFSIATSSQTGVGSSGGFGVGAFEEEDEDIYKNDALSTYDRFAGVDPIQTNEIHGSNNSVSHGRQGYGTQAAALFGGFADGPLHGFTVGLRSSEMITSEYPPPEIPEEFNPFHTFDAPGPAFDQHRTAATGNFTLASSHQLSAQERMAILDETPLPGPPPKSVFDFIKPGDKAKLKAFAAAQPRGLPVEPPTTRISPPKPGLTSAEATQPGVFRPFRKDPAKEDRYHAYLDGNIIDAPGLSVLEKGRELEEFAQSARLYRPMNSVMANRFAPATGTQGPKASLSSAPTAEPLERDVVVKDARVSAVDKKLFGSLTRETFEWHPTALLCKRFGIPDPYPQSGIDGVVIRSQLGAVRRYEVVPVYDIPDAVEVKHTVQHGAAAGLTSTSPVKLEGTKKGVDAPAIEEISEADPESEKTVRPAMDIFKAIFSGSSSSSSDDEIVSNDLASGCASVGTSKEEKLSTAQPKHLFLPPGGDVSESANSQSASVPPTEVKPLKMQLVHTYSDLTGSQNEILGNETTIPTVINTVNEEDEWIEKDTSFSVIKREDLKKKVKKDKKRKDEEKERNKKEKKKKKKKKKKSILKLSFSQSSDSDSDEQEPSDAELLAKIRSAQSKSLIIPAGTVVSGPVRPPTKYKVIGKPKWEAGHKQKGIDTRNEEENRAGTALAARRQRPSAADFM